jgi:hypothetical protein
MADPGHRGRAVELRPRLQLIEIADRADVLEALVLEQSDAGRVVASVFETLEPVKEELLRRPRAHVSHDPAHVSSPSDWYRVPKTPNPG